MLSLIRHGQTDWNAAGRMQGSSDIPLNDTGRQQAQDAVEALRGTDWDVIVSSPLQRARETAQIIADGLGLELGRSYNLLIERNYGEGEGLTKAEIDEKWPDVEVYPGLESLDSVVKRGIAALDQVSADYGDKKAIVVCHGTIIRYTLSELAGRDFDHILNGSISTIERLSDRWAVRTVNGEPLAWMD
ncbi:MAG: histidine phosphatase family protein [Rhodoglobus sp.]|uniref:histidine phosphatase family protein n=1 Tax=uncultured Salinibacterium sp. TaxID=459274 RepID=UPI0030D9AA4F|tara:strand:+ start:15727 stop:16290 length:564 start_codon:yes stop_codon:yes gene_type:complete